MQISTPKPAFDNAIEWSKYLAKELTNADNLARKTESKLVVDYYNYNQSTYLEKALAQIYTDPYSLARKRRWTHNYTRMIVDALSIAYSNRVTRSTSSGKKANAELEKYLYDDLQNAMVSGNKWMVLERTTLVMARWSSAKQKITYHNYNQYQFDLVFDDSSGEKSLWAVILSDYTSFDSCNIWVYTANNTYHFIGAKVVQEINHNIGVLPFVVIYSDDPGFNDYLLPLKEIASANLELNLAHSNLLNVLQNQAHGILVLKTPAEEQFGGIDDADPNQSTMGRSESDARIDLHDPNKVLQLSYGVAGEEPKLESLAQNANLTDAIETIRFLSNSLAASMGVDIGIFDVSATATATSFHIQERRRQNITDKYHEIFAQAEKDLIKKAYVLARMSSLDVPEANIETYSVSFSPDRSLVSQISISDVMSAYDKGIIDDIECIRQLYPTLTRNEAIEFATEMEKRRTKIEKQNTVVAESTTEIIENTEE